MDAGYADYREKWRQRRRRTRLRRVPWIILGVAVVTGGGLMSVRAHHPELSAVAWLKEYDYRGRPYLALGEGVLVVAWECGSVAAYDAVTGTPLWRNPFDRAHPFSSAPAVGESRIVLGGGDGYVRCLDLKTGQLAWGFDAETTVRSVPAIVDDRVYVGGDDGRVYCLSLKDGTFLWAYPPVDRAEREAILGGVGVSNNVLVAGSGECEAFGLDLHTGKLRWRLRFEGPIIGRVTVAGGLAYIPVENGVMRCVVAATGKTVWEMTSPFLIRFPVVVAEQRAFIFSSDGTAHCLHALTGQRLWTHKLRGRPVTAGVTNAHALYVGTSEGVVEGLSIETGEPVWRWCPGVLPAGDLIIYSGYLYCPTAAGQVWAVRLPKWDEPSASRVAQFF